MESRRKIRALTVQALFAFDAQQEASTEIAQEITLRAEPEPAVVKEVAAAAMEAWASRKTADDWVMRLAPQWPTHRQPGVDRAILRYAVWELTHRDTPPKVVLDEAIELAREFSTENSPSFINGVLDAVLKEITALKAGAPSQTAAATTSQPADA